MANRVFSVKEINTFFNSKKEKTFRKRICWFFLTLCLLVEIFKRLGVNRGNWSLLDKYRHFPPLFFFAWFCFVAPLWEELVFRWLIIKKIGKGKFLFCLISFISFVMAHFISDRFIFERFLSLSYYSMWFIFIYWLSDWNLYFPIFLHFLTNFVIFCFRFEF